MRHGASTSRFNPKSHSFICKLFVLVAALGALGKDPPPVKAGAPTKAQLLLHVFADTVPDAAVAAKTNVAATFIFSYFATVESRAPPYSCDALLCGFLPIGSLQCCCETALVEYLEGCSGHYVVFESRQLIKCRVSVRFMHYVSH